MSSNDIENEATLIISKFIPIKSRIDMGSREYTQYKHDWDTFTRVWIRDYTIETLNKNASAYAPFGSYTILDTYEFASYNEKLSYIKGQESIVSMYPSSISLFVRRPPINLSTFNYLSNLYASEIFQTQSTFVGISTNTGKLANFQGNISTLAYLSTIQSISTLSLIEIQQRNTIFPESNRSTIYSFEGSKYISSVLNDVQNDIYPTVILPIGVSTVAIYVSSYVLELMNPTHFAEYISSSINPLSIEKISTLTELTILNTSNQAYSYQPQPNISTYQSLSTLTASNIIYSDFSLAKQSTLFSLTDTFLYPESRLSTYISLSTLASLSSFYRALPPVSLSTFISLETLLSLSTLYPALSRSNLSTLFFLSSQKSFQTFVSSAAIEFDSASMSTFYTLSTYSFYIPTE
jgi:hypothetical protein